MWFLCASVDPPKPSAAVGSFSSRPVQARSPRQVVWFWTKVVLCLALLDTLLFDVGWFWRANAVGVRKLEIFWKRLIRGAWQDRVAATAEAPPPSDSQ